MGNIQQKIQQHAFKGYDYKHFQDDRSESQILITDKLTLLLSDLNTSRVIEYQNITAKSLDWSKYTFICIHGLPATRNQFEFLELPGKEIHFGAITFQEEAIKQSGKVRQNFVNLSTFESQSSRLQKQIGQINEENKIIFIYHSAGNYFLSMFLFYHGKSLEKRIKGMIDIAGGPLRFYPSSKIFIPIVMNTNFQEIMSNIDKVHDFFMKTVSDVGFNLGFRDKYETVSFFRYMKTPDYNQVFQSTWNHPKVLKLIIHGRKDTFFNSTLLNQKAIYYTYRRQLEQNYEKKLIQKYKNLYQTHNSPKNVQQKFIFAIPKGQHSVHKQTRNQQLIKSAVHQYLMLIHE